MWYRTFRRVLYWYGVGITLQGILILAGMILIFTKDCLIAGTYRDTVMSIFTGFTYYTASSINTSKRNARIEGYHKLNNVGDSRFHSKTSKMQMRSGFGTTAPETLQATTPYSN